jgi:hypothetical protein
MGLFPWSHIWIYLVANLFGGAAAAYAFRLTQPREQLTAGHRPVEADEEALEWPEPGTSFRVPRTQ